MSSIKIKTRLKIIKLKHNIIKNYYCFMDWLFKPLYVIEIKLHKRKCNINNYKNNRLKKLLYKNIQDNIMFEDELIIFDTSINFIDKEHWGYNFLKVEDLFYTDKYKYLKNYYFAKPGKSAYQYWFDIIKTFDNEDIKVEVIDKNEVFKDVLYKNRYEIYKNCNEILKITKIL